MSTFVTMLITSRVTDAYNYARDRVTPQPRSMSRLTNVPLVEYSLCICLSPAVTTVDTVLCSVLATLFLSTMPEVNNVDIGIEMDGKRLREYDTQINGVTAKSWIESEAGKVLNRSFCSWKHWRYWYLPKKFSITVKVGSRVHSGMAFLAEIDLDGCIKRDFIIPQDKVGKKRVYSCAEVGKNLVRPLVFSHSKITGMHILKFLEWSLFTESTDDESVASPMDGSSLGSIKVTLSSGITVEEEDTGPITYNYADRVDSVVHERSKKVTPHRASWAYAILCLLRRLT